MPYGAARAVSWRSCLPSSPGGHFHWLGGSGSARPQVPGGSQMLRQMQMSSRLRLLIPAAGGLVVGLLFSYLLTCVRMSYLVFFAARFHQPACRLTQICREAGLVPNTAAAFDI